MIPHCLSCGACCHSKSDQFVRVTGDDWKRLGDDAAQLAQFIGNRAFMRMAHGHCIALNVRPSTSGESEYFCTIYERRPQICRDLARGSMECSAERALRMISGAGR